MLRACPAQFCRHALFVSRRLHCGASRRLLWPRAYGDAEVTLLTRWEIAMITNLGDVHCTSHIQYPVLAESSWPSLDRCMHVQCGYRLISPGFGAVLL